MIKFINRMFRAARLDAQVYEEVEADKSALPQAMWVVILSSIAAGIGMMGTPSGGVGIITAIVGGLISWFLWALLTYWIGTKLLPEAQTRSDLGELLRTIGFSSSAGLIRALGIIPGIAGIVFAIASVWMLVAMVIAVRQALDYTSTWRAAGVCLMGWVTQVLFIIAIIALVS